MKKQFFFLLFILVFFNVKAQANFSDVHEDLLYAYSDIESAYVSNNKEHLQHFSERSLEAFESAKTVLENCDCEKTYNLAYDTSELLFKITSAKTFKDGRFYIKKAVEAVKATIDSLEVYIEKSEQDN